MPFRFQGTQMHLTFKDHIPIVDIKARLTAIGWAYKTLSIVHEVGLVGEEDEMPYEHTHVFVILRKKADITNPRFFDIEGRHPNIKHRRGMDWAITVVCSYHKGHKHKKNGKPYFEEPVMLHQEGCEEHMLQFDLLDAVIAAPSLLEALKVGGCKLKSVNDYSILRREARKRKPTQVEDGADKKRCRKVGWNRDLALVLEGPPNTGKTVWALSQFEHPSLICKLDQLRDLPEQCDGLVFDEMLFGSKSKAFQIDILCTKYERSIEARYTNYSIPKGMPRIFCINENENVFDFNHGAIARRLVHYDMAEDEKMYT